MNLRQWFTRYLKQASIILLLLFVTPALLVAQNKDKKSNNSAPSKPAPHPAPQAQRQVYQPHNNTTNSTSRNTVNRSVTRTTGTGVNGNVTNSRNTGVNKNTTVNSTNSRGNNQYGNNKGNVVGSATTGKNSVNTGGHIGANNSGSNRVVAGGNSNVRPGAVGSTNHTQTAIIHKTMTFKGRPADIQVRGGRIAHIHTQGMEIHRTLHNERRIDRVYGNGRVVVVGRGHGFYERPYVHGYIQRTYFVGGRRYAYAYRTYYWGGRPYYRYAPGFYYHPLFYGWAYRPWVTPVYWSWGWGPSPWYGYYGYYFAPAPYYPSASLWLTDYLLAENLRLSYEAQSQNSQPGPPPQEEEGAVVLTPEVKEAIAQEVRAQLEAERQAAAASGGTAAQPAGDDIQAPPALDPKHRTFVVSGSLDVTGANEQECSLTAGDVIVRTGDPDGDRVNVLVQASKKGDCEAGSTATVQVADLQEMHNHFREQIDAGLQTLAEKQGHNGLPSAPDTGTTRGEIAPPAPDSGVDSQLQKTESEADDAEKQASPGSIPH
ncbi:MAG TPA: hypothetical protein VI636_01020 [Candidatus Angelobacter sp.]